VIYVEYNCVLFLMTI